MLAMQQRWRKRLQRVRADRAAVADAAFCAAAALQRAALTEHAVAAALRRLARLLVPCNGRLRVVQNRPSRR
jgi:hypothetical protein